MTKPNPIIELLGISKVFGKNKKTILKHVSLKIYSGDFLAVMGQSGAGKSTLLSILGLLDRPSSGTYKVEGVETSTLTEMERNKLRSRIFGFVFQSSMLVDDFTVIENATLGLRIQGMDRVRRTQIGQNVLESVGIDERPFSKAGVLSGGQRQRLAIARATATSPKIILADEPTGNLDKDNAQRVMELLFELRSEGATVIVVTHEDSIAAQADRIITLKDGLIHSDVSKKRLRINRINDLRTSRDLASSNAYPRFSPLITKTMDDFVEVLNSIRQRWLRTLLLLSAFAFGVGGLVLAIGLSNTAASQVGVRLDEASLDEVRVLIPNGIADVRDRQALKELVEKVHSIPHVLSVGWLARGDSQIANISRFWPASESVTSPLNVLSASPEYFEIQGYEDSLALFTALQDGTLKNVAILGANSNKELQSGSPLPGSTFWMNNSEVAVIDLLPKLSGSDKSILNNSVIVTPEMIFADKPSLVLLIKTEPGFPAAIAEAVPYVLDPANPTQFNVETAADLRNLKLGVSNDFGIFISIASTVLLVLALFSAGLTLYLNVVSRGSEIALRRAIGASKKGVAQLFLIEGGVLGFVGGLAGVSVGVYALLAMSKSIGWEPVFSPEYLLLGISIGVFSGFLASSVPAYFAMRKEPAAAMRVLP